MSTPREHGAYHTLTRHLALAAPAIPMVVVQAWADQEEDGTWKADHRTDPVVNLIVTEIDRYRHAMPDARRGSDARDLLRYGWAFDDSVRIIDAILVDPDLGITHASDLCAVNLVYEIVACLGNWPGGDPVEAAIIRVKAAAIEKTQRRDRMLASRVS